MRSRPKKQNKSNTEILAEVINTDSVNPLMTLLVELNEQFEYGKNGTAVKTINILLNHWFDTAGKDTSLNKHDFLNTLYHVTNLTSFLTSLQESFHELKSNQPELEKALTR